MVQPQPDPINDRQVAELNQKHSLQNHNNQADGLIFPAAPASIHAYQGLPGKGLPDRALAVLTDPLGLFTGCFRPIRQRSARRFLILLLVLAIGLLTACNGALKLAEPVAIDPDSDPDTYQTAARDLAWNGNLHYQNFVFYGDRTIFLSAEDGTIARLAHHAASVRQMDNHPGCQFAGYDNWLFYGAGQLNNTVRKIMTDGTNSVRISTHSYQYLIASKDYLMGILTATGQVMRMTHDGTDRQSLFDGFATELQFDGQSLYVCGSQDKTGLVRIDPETGTSTVLLRRRIISLNKVGDWLYFTDPSDQHRIHAWSESEKKDSRIGDFSLTRPFIVYGGWLYYLDPYSSPETRI